MSGQSVAAGKVADKVQVVIQERRQGDNGASKEPKGAAPAMTAPKATMPAAPGAPSVGAAPKAAMPGAPTITRTAGTTGNLAGTPATANATAQGLRYEVQANLIASADRELAERGRGAEGWWERMRERSRSFSSPESFSSLFRLFSLLGHGKSLRHNAKAKNRTSAPVSFGDAAGEV